MAGKGYKGCETERAPGRDYNDYCRVCNRWPEFCVCTTEQEKEAEAEEAALICDECNWPKAECRCKQEG